MMHSTRSLMGGVSLVLLICQLSFGQIDPPSTGPNGCANAPLLCSIWELDEYQGSTMMTPPSNPCPFSQATDCPNSTCENNQWFSFIANSTEMQIEIAPSMCEGGSTGNALQGVIWEVTDCTTVSGFTPVSNCFSNAAMQNFTLFATGLIPGNIYMIMLDGFSGATCGYEVNVLSGGPPIVPPTLSGPITGPDAVCPGAEDLVYCIDVGSGISSYDWSWLGSSLGTITELGLSADGTQFCISIDITGQGASLIQLVGSNECYEAAPVNFGPIVSTPIINPIQNDFICLGSSISWECYPLINSPGQFTCDYESWLGCDSSISIIVGIYPPTPPLVEIITICEEECPYMYNGNELCSSGTYNFDYLDDNGCEVSDILFLTVLPAESVILSPDAIGCGADTIVTLDGSLSTSSPELGSTISYLWTGPGILTDSSLITIDVNEPGIYTLSVSQTRDGVICTSETSVQVLEDNAFPNSPSLNGEEEICGLVTNSIYTIVPSSTGVPENGFTWEVVGGSFISNSDGDTITVSWDALGLGQVCAGAYNDCDTSALTCLDITIGENPIVEDLIGDLIVCETDTALVYTLNPTASNLTYSWSLTGGASFIDLGDSISVDFTGTSAVQICVQSENSCGLSNQICEDIEITTLPTAPSISGVSELCAGNIDTYQITTDSSITAINWVLPSNASSLGGQGTSSIDIEWISSGVSQLCAEVSNGCGSTQSCLDIEIYDNPSATISGDLFYCEESTDSLSLDLLLTGVSPWDLTLALDGVDIQTINISNSPAQIPVLGTGVYTISQLTDANTCSGIGLGQGTVNTYTVPTAELSGTGSICEGSGDCALLQLTMTGTAPYVVTYAIDGVSQAPITGIALDAIDLEICVAGEISLLSLSDGNACQGTVSGLVSIQENTIPIVSNIDNSCDPNDDTEYTVSFDISSGDASSYTILPLASGTLSGTLFTSNPISSGSPYAFQVFDTNGCDTVEVNGIFVCNCGNDVGLMDQQIIDICVPDCAAAIYDNALEVLSGNDILQFVLHEGAGLSLEGIVAFNSIPQFCFDASAGMVLGQTYYISAITGDDDGSGNVDLSDLCLAVAQGTPVRYYELPSASFGTNGEICIGETYEIEVNFNSGNSPWNLVYDDGAGLDTLTGINASNYQFLVDPLSTTNYCFIEVFNEFCSTILSDCIEVVVNESPQVNDILTSCNDTGDAFSVSFEISGGDAGSYEVLPPGSGVLSAGSFISSFIPEGSTYSFEVIDANLCDTILVSTSVPVDCECISMVGTILDSNFELCGPQVINADYDGGEILDGNDILNFILYSGDINEIDSITIIDQNTTGSFSYDSNTMSYGETYYMVAAVANEVAGLVQLNDACLALTTSIPVVYYEIPDASLSGSEDICLGESSQLEILFTGDAPYSVELTETTGSEVNSLVFTDIGSESFSFSVSPTETATYAIVNISDENCSGTFSGGADIIVNEAPTASIPLESINIDNTHVTVSFTISGGIAPYTITDADGNVFISADGNFSSPEILCGNGYYFEVDDNNLCGPDIVLSPMTDCPCLTTSGILIENTLQEICNDTVTLSYDDSLEYLDGNDTLQFIIHNGDYSPLVAPSDTPFFVYGGLMNYGETYFVSVVAGDQGVLGGVNSSGACLDTVSLAPVIFYEIPIASLSGDGDICIGESIDLLIDFSSGQSPWTIDLLNEFTGEISQFVLTESSSVLSLSPDITTTYSLISVSDNVGLCSGAVFGSALVQVQTAPEVSSFQGSTDFDNETYTVTFNISGGDQASYAVSLDQAAILNTGNISGNAFTSIAIPCSEQGQSYTYYISDDFACAIEEVVFEVDCECFTSAGTFDNSSLRFCYEEDIFFSPISNSNLDGNDVINYLTVSSPSNWENTIIDISTTTQFTNDPSLYECGTNYFILAVVGDDAGNGLVDLGDQCLAISTFNPFSIYCPVDVNFDQGSYETCIGNSVDIGFDFEGEGPFELILNNGSGNDTITGIEEGELISLDIMDSTLISLISVLDLGSGCSAILDGEAMVNVNGVPEAGVVNSSPAYCFGEFYTDDLYALIDGEDAGGIWSETSALPSTGLAFNASLGTFSIANQEAGTYTFEYFIEGEGLCPDDSELVTIVINELPLADAGEDTEVSCDEYTSQIGGLSSSGPNIQYNWTDDSNVSLGVDPLLTVDYGGVFTLTVANNLTGCIASDEVYVENKIDVLLLDVNAQDISCNGYQDGLLIINDVEGGEGPYVYSIDGGNSFSDDDQYFNLEAGVYSIEVMDANGCTNASLEYELSQPAPLAVDIIGDFSSSDNSISYGDSVLLSVNTNAELYDIQWTPSSLVSCDTCPVVMVAPLTTSIFNVNVQAGICSEREAISILVRKDEPVFVPSAFSPNNDNVNDVLTVFVGDFVREIKSFQIFDRWGEQVHYRTNFRPNNQALEEHSWNGTLEGKLCNVGVYVYYLEVEFEDGNVKLFKGDVSLLK